MAKNLGNFDVIEGLVSAYPVGAIGDYATVGTRQYSYMQNGWVMGGFSAPEEANEIFPSTAIYIDCNRIDEYEETGTVIKPFKKISTAIASISDYAASYAFILVPGLYVETSSIIFPDSHVIIQGNGSSLNVTGSITILSEFFIQSDLDITVSNSIIFSNASAGRILINGGFIRGSINTTGLTTFKSVTLSGGTITVADTSQLSIFQSTISSIITSAGILIMYENSVSGSSATGLIISTGGIAWIINNIIQQVGAGAGIQISNGATGLYWYNYIINNVIAVAGGANISCGTSVTIYAKCLIYGGVNTGSGLRGVNSDVIGAGTIMMLGSDATGDIYYRSAAGLLARLPIGHTGQILKVVAGLPKWEDD